MSKIAFLFPGQGAQHVGMGADLAAKLPAVRQLYDRANAVLGFDLAKLCFEGPAEELDSTVISQPALFVTSLAAVEALRAESPEVVLSCEAAAGLSLGEYTALTFAGVLDFDDGLRLVQLRGAAMQDAADAVPSGMVSILGMERGCRRSSIRHAARIFWKSRTCFAREILQYPAATRRANGPPSWLKSLGAMKAVPLAVAGAFHTKIMEPAVARLSAGLAKVKMHDPKIPVVSNVDALTHANPKRFACCWSNKW